MAFYRCFPVQGGGELELVANSTGTGAASLQYTGNTSSTLWLALAVTGSSNQDYRETSSNLSAYSGCTPTSLKMNSVGNATYRLYKLTGCSSTVNVAATSYGSSSIVKNLMIFKIN